MFKSYNFNPRSHERSDGCGRRKMAAGENFNPRSHERSDQITYTDVYSQLISIHAPTRGATGSMMYDTMSVEISIHAPTRGATAKQVKDYEEEQNFNPRSHERSDETSSNEIIQRR